MTRVKKPLYRGDPNSPFTICYKKRRRHNQNDVHYLRPDSQEQDKPVQLIPFCKHCKEHPYDMEKLQAQVSSQEGGT